MITLLKKSDYSEGPWKNGKGSTSQISIFPEHTDISKNNFLWRISSATISSSGPFSLFPGYERQLAIWKGEGLKLNNAPLLQSKTITFSGETEIQCDLIGAETVTDLGIIYKKDKVSAGLSIHTFDSEKNLTLGAGVHFLFLAKGENFFANHLRVEEGETLKIENENFVILYSKNQTPFTLIFISIIHI
jgi:environmental stress-induced protein Ves